MEINSIYAFTVFRKTHRTCLIFFSCGIPAPPILMPVGVLLVHTEAGGGSGATLGVCVHKRGAGSAHQAAAHHCQAALASWVVCIGTAECPYSWFIAKVATKVDLISHLLLRICSWLLCTLVMRVLNCPRVHDWGPAFTVSHSCLCTSFYIRSTHIHSHTYPKKSVFLTKHA